MRKITLILPIILSVFMATAVFATTIDLKGAIGDQGSATAAIGGTFIAVAIPQAPTGTGVFDPFVRIQASGNEEGYNTSLNLPSPPQPPLDDKGGIWTHALRFGDIPRVTIGGIDYREFILDINEDSGGPKTDPHEWLSLNQIQIFIGPDTINFTLDPTASDATDPIISFGAGYSEKFRLNDANESGTDRNVIELNYALQSGSGSGDMALYIPEADFLGVAAGSNLILYSQFGSPRGFSASSDGFEEWALRVGEGGGNGGGGKVPEPSTLLLLGSGLLGALPFVRRRFKK